MKPHRQRARLGHASARIYLALAAAAPASAQEQPPEPAEPAASEELAEEESMLFSEEDGCFDVSRFLDEKYGFLPIVMPITEPAVGYGAAGALMFLSKPLGAAKEGLGRPNITMVGGLGTENGTWGALAGDMRYWLDDRLQTLVGVIRSDINLDFHGIGDDSLLDQDPLRYEVSPTGGFAQGKTRLGDTNLWAGLSYALAQVRVSFDDPPGTAGIPAFEREMDVAGLTPSITYDTRDNIFTTTKGSYVELGCGFFGESLGGDDEFQRLRLAAMHYVPMTEELFLGLRADVAASYGDCPFFLRPYVTMRGVPQVRYQGEETAQFEAELRWQYWKRFSLVGFGGVGAAWNDSQHLDNVASVIAGGAGFRYELARDYGIHAGVDVAFSRDTAAVYVQVGGAWARP